jgi:TolA-binding protein
MKISRLAAAIVAFALSAHIVSAQEISAPTGSTKSMDMDKQLSQMQKDMNAMLEQIAKLRQQSQLQKNMNEMQRQIDKLQTTTDPKERQMLIQEHLQTMQEHMKMIRSMSEPEGGSTSKMEAPQNAPGRMAGPGGMMYGPSAMGFPGGMMYGPSGPSMMGGPQGYPGGMIGPARVMGSAPGGAAVPRYK